MPGPATPSDKVPSNMTSSSPSVVEALEGALEWRCIGPYRAGRVIAVAGDPVDPRVFYFGSVGGGVWKSTDGGTYWQNVSDGFLSTASVGAIAVAQSDPNVVYAGMGETCIRIDLTHGDGVYRSDDAGATWTHLGLEDTRHISRVRVHPNDPNLVYVAAFGHAFGPSSSAASSGRRTAASRGRTSCTRARTPARPTCRWTPTTRASSTPPCGRPGAPSGR